MHTRKLTIIIAHPTPAAQVYSLPEIPVLHVVAYVQSLE